ncbi:hypothetical protein HAX54_037685 [Datura stramonium]|uniref:Uncharacterized protein n=1 Tax=Datura stramonium TaxID=4076 RepID=A0ABS8VJW1_DATST|nr:hypothetical protein [Datura stramonium]
MTVHSVIGSGFDSSPMAQYSLNSKKNDYGSTHSAGLQARSRGMMAGKQILEGTMGVRGLAKNCRWKEIAQEEQKEKGFVQARRKKRNAKPVQQWVTKKTADTNINIEEEVIIQQGDLEVANAMNMTDQPVEENRQVTTEIEVGNISRGALSLMDFPELTPTPTRNGFGILEQKEVVWNKMKPTSMGGLH